MGLRRRLLKNFYNTLHGEGYRGSKTTYPRFFFGLEQNPPWLGYKFTQDKTEVSKSPETFPFVLFRNFVVEHWLSTGEFRAWFTVRSNFSNTQKHEFLKE